MLKKVQTVLAEPLVLDARAHSVTCSIGVSIFPQHGDNAAMLLKSADAAMYTAKNNGRNQIAFFDSFPAESL